MNWEVGQSVWVVPRDSRSKPHAEVIGKVARKWVTFDPPWRGRFDGATGAVDGGRDYLAIADVWTSKDEYEAWFARNEKWLSMMQRLPHQVPDHLTDFDLELIRDLIAGKS